MRWFLLILLLLVLAGAGAAGGYFLLKPQPTKYHPEFGTDCAALLTPATQNAVDCVRVLFGTNRELALEGREPGAAEETDVRKATSNDAGQLLFGRADVWLPKLIEEGGSRDRGETPILEGPPPEEPSELAKYVFLTRITQAGRETFLSELDEALANRGSESALLFVHGFNTPFDDALIRSAQLSVDLSRRGIFDVGVPVLFSWPSAGRVSLGDYRGDQDRSLAAAPYLEEFLDVLTGNAQIRRINIVAHSMGNRILTEALESYASDYLERKSRGDIEFRIILVAADVDRDIFEATTGILDNLQANITIYTSDADRALHVSRVVNNKLRLGDTNGDKPFIRANPYYQTVDATGIATELFGLGHNYYSDNPFILGDIVCALAEANPEKRALERRRYGSVPDGLEYFRVNVGLRPAEEDCSLYRTAFPLQSVSEAPVQPQRMRVGAPTPAPEEMPQLPMTDDGELEALETVPPPPPPPRPPPPPPPSAAPPPPVTAPAPRYEVIPSVFLRMQIEDRRTFSPGAYADEILPALRAGEVSEIRIEAHTDGAGEREAERALSQSWAEAMRDWLIAQGVDPAIIVSVTGYGSDRPLEVVDEGQRSAISQRIEVRIEYKNGVIRYLEDDE
ncbi:alpha/beta hydrolase [Hyphomonas sp.]|uniref:alpha/beta hydrolase n=1 Tax=Hyphomonas sp. TaxID=87 RepID=UPI00391C7398